MYKTILPAGLLCLLVGASALAVAPPPRPLGAVALDRLIEQLGHRDYRQRELAERTLYAQGMAALPHLRKALGSRDAEVRRRAMRLIPGLEHAALVAPRRFSLVVANKPLAVVLEELSKASGYKVMLQNNGMPPVVKPGSGEPTYSYGFINTSFWAAIDQICRDTNMVVQQSWGDDTVRLWNGGRASHVGRDGAFRFSATSFQMYRNVDLSAYNPTGNVPTRTENLTFSFNLFAEPRLPFLGMGEVRLDAAYDNDRNSMLVKADPTEGPGGGPGVMGRMMGRRYYGGGYKQTTMQVSVNLQRPSEKATTMKYLKGVVPVTLLVEQQAIVLSDKIMSAKGVKKTVGDLEFHIETVTKQANNQVQVKFTVSNKGKSTDYTWMNTLYQRLELQDEKGVKFQNWGSSWGSSGNNNVQLTLTFGHFGAGKAPTPSRFVYQHWITRQHDIPFVFKDVPLP